MKIWIIEESSFTFEFRSKLEKANESGQVSEEVGKLINARTSLMFTKHNITNPDNRKRGHLRVAFRKFVTKLQSDFFNPRIPQWTGYNFKIFNYRVNKLS